MKFALDTNVFVDAFRDETFAEALAAFLEQLLLSTFLSAVPRAVARRESPDPELA